MGNAMAWVSNLVIGQAASRAFLIKVRYKRKKRSSGVWRCRERKLVIVSKGLWIAWVLLFEEVGRCFVQVKQGKEEPDLYSSRLGIYCKAFGSIVIEVASNASSE